MERTNIRNITKDDVEDDLDFVSIDVSFISLKLVLPVAKSLMKDKAELIALIKPQFEAGRDKVGKKGVVREKSTHEEVIQKIIDFVKALNLKIIGIQFSPIKGPEGNIEYLIYFTKDKNYEEDLSLTIAHDIVELSHENLDER